MGGDPMGEEENQLYKLKIHVSSHLQHTFSISGAILNIPSNLGLQISISHNPGLQFSIPHNPGLQISSSIIHNPAHGVCTLHDRVASLNHIR